VRQAVHVAGADHSAGVPDDIGTITYVCDCARDARSHSLSQYIRKRLAVRRRSQHVQGRNKAWGVITLAKQMGHRYQASGGKSSLDGLIAAVDSLPSKQEVHVWSPNMQRRRG
jgi:hypothetical protein